MALYASQYTNIYPSHRGNSLLFHGIKGTIDEVDKKLAAILNKTRQSGEPLDNLLDQVTLDYLKDRGHVTKLDSQQEWAETKNVILEIDGHSKESVKKRGSLMLVPSYDCNLACPYCYQCQIRSKLDPKSSQTMTPETVDLIFGKAFKNLFPSVEHYSQVHVALYGGEPFLQKHHSSLERIIHHTLIHQMEVMAVSNATTLHSILPIFGRRRGLVNWLQISFDGDKEFHDKSRITRGGAGTFDKIIENIHKLINLGVSMALRINTSAYNIDTLNQLVDCLKKEEIAGHPQVHIYAAAVHGHADDALSDFLISEFTLSNQVEKNELDIGSPLQRTIDRLAHLVTKDSAKPLRRSRFCMQSTAQSYVIDLNKKIYGCYDESGKEDLSIGHIDESGAVHFNERYQIYQNRHVGAYDPCSRCPVVLTCGGGCPVAARGNGTSPEGIYRQACNSQKALVAKAIQKIFKQQLDGIYSNTELLTRDDVLADQPML